MEAMIITCTTFVKITKYEFSRFFDGIIVDWNNFYNKQRVFLIIFQIPLLHATEEYPNTYECGFHFFTAPEGKLISPRAIPCAKLAEEIAELLNDEEMFDGKVYHKLYL